MQAAEVAEKVAEEPLRTGVRLDLEKKYAGTLTSRDLVRFLKDLRFPVVDQPRQRRGKTVDRDTAEAKAAGKAAIA